MWRVFSFDFEVHFIAIFASISIVPIVVVVLILLIFATTTTVLAVSIIA